MLGSMFDQIMKEQPSSLSAEQEMGIMKVKAESTHLQLQALDPWQPKRKQSKNPVNQPRSRPLKL